MICKAPGLLPNRNKQKKNLEYIPSHPGFHCENMIPLYLSTCCLYTTSYQTTKHTSALDIQCGTLCLLSNTASRHSSHFNATESSRNRKIKYLPSPCLIRQGNEGLWAHAHLLIWILKTLNTTSPWKPSLDVGVDFSAPLIRTMPSLFFINNRRLLDLGGQEVLILIPTLLRVYLEDWNQASTYSLPMNECIRIFEWAHILEIIPRASGRATDKNFSSYCVLTSSPWHRVRQLFW